jgi:hypothetical protein
MFNKESKDSNVLGVLSVVSRTFGFTRIHYEAEVHIFPDGKTDFMPAYVDDTIQEEVAGYKVKEVEDV